MVRVSQTLVHNIGTFRSKAASDRSMKEDRGQCLKPLGIAPDCRAALSRLDDAPDLAR